jgi:flagellin-specific chaperone FliS
LLALYDGAIERLEQAVDALASDRSSAAAPALLRAQRIVVELLGGVNRGYGELAQNLERLYIFVLLAIGSRSAADVAGALRVMRTLRDEHLEIRAEAAELERSGKIPGVEAIRGLRAIG